MNAEELISALRTEHRPIGRTRPECFAHGDYGVPWPCSARVAAERIARVLDMHAPTNERFCPMCGCDTEPIGYAHPHSCPTYAALNGVAR